MSEVTKNRYDRSVEVLTRMALFALERPEKINNYMNKSLDRILGPMWDFAAGYDHLPANRMGRFNPYYKKAKKSELEKISMN